MTNEVIRTLVGMKTNTTMQNSNKMKNSNNMNAKNLSGWKGLGGMYAMRYVSMIAVLLMLGVGNAWGGGTHYVSATTADPAQGLVYLSTSNQSSVADSNFKNSQPGGLLVSTASSNNNTTNACYITGNGSGCSMSNEFYWARPSRGYEFNGSWGTRGTNYPSQPASTTGGCTLNDQANHGPWTGTADVIQSTAGGSQATWIRPTAYFKQATKYTVTYAVPEGGSYTVHYEYRESYNTGSTESDGTAIWRFKTSTEDYSLTPSTAEAIEVTSYAADNITLTVPNEATNFIGWYEGSTQKSTNKSYTYTAHDNVTVFPMFKELAWGDVTGDLSVNVTAKGAYGSKIVYVAIPTLIGSWSSSEFTVTPTNPSNDFGSIHIDDVSLNKTVTPNRLEITYTYTASEWGGIDATFTITPAFGSTKQFSVACFAEEVVDYEACIEEDEVRTYTGTLAAMMTQANSMDNEPTVKLMQDMTITAPLSFVQSMTFDVNGKVLTANCASAFSIDAEDVDVKIIDGSFTQVGEIHTSYASASAVSVVTFTQAAKLTMNGGTLSAENTGAGAAYGIDVQQGSIFYMTGGDMTVEASTGNAQGVHVATSSDYATLNGGSINVSAPTNAYGLWSAGQSNITDAVVSVETSIGANAYGAYINGGITTITTTDVTSNAQTSNAYGAYVNAGRLNFNGGSLDVAAVASAAYGAYIAAGATCNIQQNAVVKAEATGVSGTNVFGINNLGTVSLNNLSVTATSPTNYATAVNSETSAVSTTIEDGTYTANTETGYAYGLHHQYGVLNVDGGTFKGIVKTSGTGAYGVRAAVNATIANATMLGEAKSSAGTAYGFVGGVANKTITLTNCDITGKSNTSKAYAIYSNTNVTATSCTLTATTLGSNEAYGIYANAGTNNITNCNATVSAYTVKAYGVNHVAGSLTISGGQYDVEAKQTTATGAQSSELYGLYNAASQTATVTGATFNVTATNAAYSQNVYGAYINGTLNSSNSTYDVEGKLQIYGIYGNSASTLNLSDNTIDAEAKNGTTAYGVYTIKNFTIDGDIVRAKGSSTGVYSLYFNSASTGNVLDGKFYAMGNGTNGYGALNADASTSKVHLKGGVYSVHTNLRKYAYTGYGVYTLDDTHPDFADGYRYTIATENPSQYVCYIKNGHKYETLEAALQYTKDNNGTYVIIMSQNYTLPAGDYELPSNATLLIPRDADQTTIAGASSAKRTIAGIREEHIRLTLAQGVTLNVNGKIEVGGELWCTETGSISRINSPYARMHMEEGSYIQLNSGAYLYAWGYITGSGEIKVKNNAEVHELFQIGGMPSMSNLIQKYLNNSNKYFPINQYYIQNIEVPTTYYYNSRLICSMSNYYKGATFGNGFNYDDNIKIVGTSGAMFLVDTDDESSWVRKSYNPTTDYQVWDVSSDAKLGSLSITLDGYTLNTSSYILPIANNMKIHVVDGDFSITQSTEFLPGTQVEVNKTASLTIKSGQNLYIFDKDQWPFSVGGVEFSPSWTNGSRPSRTAAFVDALINVHGNINVEGKLYTSKSIASGTNATKGANIYSVNADAGTIKYNTATGTSDATVNLMMTDATTTKAVTMELAQLKNGDASFTSTSGTASGEAFAYIDNLWQKTYTNGCFFVIGSTVYAKPSEYVALKKSQTDANSKLTGVEETNHTYLTTEDKILILMDDCQWWEVEATEDPSVFECKKEGYEGFYYYDNTAGKWKIKTVNVKFYSAETGDDVLKTIVTDWKGIPDQSVIASNPTKATTTGYTYTFYGWKSSVTGDTISWTGQLEVATADMSYRPVFTETKRNYTITLNDANNGATVYLEVPYGDIPEYTPRKDATAQYTYSFNGWSPAFAAVTGTATYNAQWTHVTNRYTITWMNGEDVLETDKSQAYGATTSYDGTTPTIEADNEYAYTFSGWLNSLTGNMRVNNETVTGAITYTAQFSTTPRYMITFANYDGTQLQKEAVTQNETPVYNGVTPARARDLDGYYIFTGWKRNSTGVDYAPNATLPAATQKETYTAQYSYTNDLFLITLKNVDGNGATWSGKFGEGATPFYNPNNDDVPVIPTKTGNAQYSYTFNGWSLTSGGAKLDPVPAVTGEATYWALFTQTTNKYDITFANIDGFGASQTIQVEYGSTPVCPVTPLKEQGINSWAFDSWAEGDPVAVTEDATYTATFSSTPTVRQYDITFNPNNGGANQVHQVTHGDTPAWEGANPTKAQTAQYAYAFAGWDPEIEPATEDMEYTALYEETTRSYTITFKNYDGTTLATPSVNYGATPSYSGTPTKPVADGYAYTFDGWSTTNGGSKLNSLPSVTGEATYYAHYNQVALVASVTTASNETTYYSKWGENDGAFYAANNNATGGCTITLYVNVTNPSNNTEIKKNMTIDLNGHTISLSTNVTSNARLFYINSAVTLTINDSQGGGKIYYEGTNSTTYSAIYVNSSGAVIMNGGTIQAHATKSGNNYYASPIYLYGSNSRLTVNGGELIGSHGTSSRKAYAVRFRGTSYGYADIKGGKLKVMAGNSITASNVSIFYNSSSNRTTLSGGYYSKDPGTSLTIATGYEKVSIANASADPEYNNDYRYKVVPKSYTLTWNLDGGTVTTAGTAAAVNATGSPSGSVAYTTALTAPVVERVGYTFSGWNTTVAATMPASNTTYTAQWTPRTDTEYKVKHYKQKLDGSYDATPDDTDNLQGTTAANVTPAVKSYTGFTAPNTQTKAIAADGSLVITYQYTRNSYLLTWNLDGGKVTTAGTAAAVDETAPSGNVKYETPITAPVVARVGYTFAGWNTSIASTMPTSDLTYTATWIPNTNTPYAVKHYKQNLDGTYPSTPTETQNLTGTTATEVTPVVKSYTGFTAPSTQTKAIAADGSLVITYQYTRNSYLLTWNLDGGKVTTAGTAAAVDETEPSDNVKYETAITTPVVSRVGYTFNGWNTSIASTMPAAATTYTATWTPNTNTPYTVKHYKQKLDGTYSSTPDETDNLTGTTATSVTPDRKSYAGFTAPSGQTVTILADGSRVLEYKYTRNSYTLEWTTDGDDLTGTYTSGSTLYEASITAPNTPTKTGYTFAAWSPTPAATMPAEDTEYAATWTPNTDTKYAVKHWQQNLADDDYTEVTDDREELEGTTATTTAASANTYTGFTAQPISQGTIAADGSAVVNVYYNRNKYTITWKDGDGTTIKTDANVKYGATPSYDGSTPTKSDDEDCTYSFAGMWTPAFETVTSDQSYTALFNAALKGEGFGTYLDIVDWTESTLTINANGWLASGWPYTINGVAYLKSDRADDRTLTIPYSGSADEEWGIIVRKTGGVNFSGRSYTIPHIYNSSATLSGTTASSVVFVRGGSLTVAADAIVGAIYVAPEAELIVNEDVTLTVDSLMLRTTAWKAASLENNGTITSDKTYYTRIVAYSGGYQQFALPLSSSISGMRLSNSDKSVYGKTWILKSYNEASRAANGNISTEEISNWDVLTEETNTISATVGYEMYSNSQYYREYYFPVTLPIESVTMVAVSRTENGAAGKSHEGWNAICSPLLGKFTQDFGNNPEDGLKVSELTEDGRYWQHIPEVIRPVVPFFYQAPHSGNLDFSGSAMSLTNAPRRSWNTSIPTQWLRLSINDINGKMLDETNIYSHPEKFSVAYETGYDVAKQSTESGRAAIYTELACGKLAFAAIPDSMAATRIPLTVYADSEGEYVFAMVQNKYIARLQYVLLHDTETGAITDLMSGSYTTELMQGTTADRFYIECVFHEDAPSVATDIEETDAPKKEVGQKIIYNEKIFILYRGRVYDITGRQCELH